MFLIDTLLGIGGKLVDRLVPDVNKKQDQDHEARMGNQEINKSLAGNTNVWVAMSVALPRYLVVILVVYMIGAAIFKQEVPSVIREAFQLLLPVLAL